MHGNLPAEAQRAIFPRVTSDAETCDQTSGVISDSESSGWFAKLARKLWSPKPPAAVEHLTGAPLSTCQRWCRDGSDITGTALRDLIRGSDGGRVLDELMRGAKPAWWQQYQFALAALPAVEQLRQLSLPLK